MFLDPLHPRVNVPHAQIGPIAVHFPALTESSDQLEIEYPEWHIPELTEKTGIRTRYLAAPGETPSDLGYQACVKLFKEHAIDPASVDFLLYCTQTPDYPLPTTACLLQDRLGLGIHCGALDFNLGCSGYVYGLSLAEGLICSGQAKRILLVTAETYSKYIVPADRSLRPIFSDAAAATLIDASDTPSLVGFEFGTDGKGANTLIVCEGGARPPSEAIQPRRRKRWGSRLYMDGPGLMDFTVGSIPQLVRNILRKANLSMDDIDLFLMHQATRKMLELLQAALGVNGERLPIRLENRGNTVSSTLPILIDDLRREEKLVPGRNHLMVGFGVGWSWAGCVWKT